LGNAVAMVPVGASSHQRHGVAKIDNFDNNMMRG
jgi:hypothetical protein